MIWLLWRRVALGLTYRRQNCAASAAFSFWKSQISFRVLGQTVSWLNFCPLLESQQHEFSLRESHPPSASPPPPPLSIFKASAHWSQVGLQTWVMWLRLTHALRHQPSVWSQQWHKHYSKHTHTSYTEKTHRQTDLAVPTFWNPVMQTAIIITLCYVIIIEKLKINPSVIWDQPANSKHVLHNHTHTLTHSHAHCIQLRGCLPIST